MPDSPLPLPLPRLSAPATRTMADAGVTDLRQLSGRPEKEVLALHGLGPGRLGVLRSALAEHGLAFTDPVARPKATGRSDDTASTASPVDPREWISGLSTERRVEEGVRLFEMFGEVTGESGVMWGPSIVGFGHHHYIYDTGREGDTCRIDESALHDLVSAAWQA